MSADFVHLHVHSEFSVLDGACKIPEIIGQCKAYDMDACALTDHGALFGLVDFYEAAKREGVKPVLGSELYLARGKDRFDRSARSSKAAYYHLLLLCENETGYRNLCKLSSLGYIDGFHYRPRVDFGALDEHREGLIAGSACVAGEIPQLLLRDDLDGAEKALKRYLDIFGTDSFIIELMDHNMPEEKKVNPLLLELANRHGLTAVATNDAHYISRADAEPHEALLAIQTNTALDQVDRFQFPTDEFYFRSPDEMAALFKDHPEVLTNTRAIAERCNVDLAFGQHLIPQYAPPEEMSKPEFLRKLVMVGLQERYDGKPSPTHVERAEYELGIIETMGFVDYFLVVWDLIAHARSKGIPVGPGRGSGAGSLVAYALRITNIDPIRYGLLFERFLNPERVSMPDFDLDFCYMRREEVIEYVRQKYGRDNVSQIITFGRMLAKQAIRNVGRVLGMSYGDVDRIAKLVPDELKITLESAHNREPELERLVKEDPDVSRLWRLATRLEGTIGTCGTHAAGVVICDQPLTDHVPLFKASGSEIVATQYEMKNVEKIGLLKMDFLGLRTLTVVHEAVRLIKHNRGIDIDIDAIEPDDPKTYALLRSGKTTGVFQLESAGMRDLAQRIGLESLEEICALVALYRPGPMLLKDQYIEHKQASHKIQYDHPLLEPILKETYGVALYQEQVMETVQAVAGFTLGQADILRRAMGKKKADLMAKQHDRFIEGAKAKGIDAETAETLFGRIAQFAGYGFNKSHSMAYAYVAYQTAFLKANYPVEFMAALLTSETGNLDKVGMYVEECRRMGIEVLPPDVNKSSVGFAVENDCIRFGMGAVKNVGDSPAAAIVAERAAHGPFADVFDFCGRLDSRTVHRRLIESLNKAGAFLSTSWKRSEVEAVLDTALQDGQVAQRDRESGQTSLLDLMDDGAGANAFRQKPELPEWPENEVLAKEKEMLGLYVTSHPLANHADTLERFSTIRIADLPELREGHECVIGGLIGAVKHYTTQRGKRMAFVTIDTLEGPCELTVFSDLFEQAGALLEQDRIVMAPARVSYRNDAPGLVATDLMPIEDAQRRLTRAVHVVVDGADDAVLAQLAEILGGRPGSCDVYIHCRTPDRDEVVVHATSACKVAPSEFLRQEVEALLGTDSLWYSSGNGLPSHPE